MAKKNSTIKAPPAGKKKVGAKKGVAREAVVPPAAHLKLVVVRAVEAGQLPLRVEIPVKRPPLPADLEALVDAGGAYAYVLDTSGLGPVERGVIHALLTGGTLPVSVVILASDDNQIVQTEPD